MLKVIKRIETGSVVFFKNYPDFNPHDRDYIEFCKTNEFKFIERSRIQELGVDVFYVKVLNSPDEYIDCAVEHGIKTNTGMIICEFLLPEYIKFIGMTVDRLPRLAPLFDVLDKKHLYLKIIYEAYLKNGKFELTDEQRLAAYEEYKRERPDRYNN